MQLAHAIKAQFLPSPQQRGKGGEIDISMQNLLFG